MSENESRSERREEAHHAHLDEVLRRLAALEHRLEELEARMGEARHRLEKADTIPTMEQGEHTETGYPLTGMG
jgi:hypothetical protein